MFGRGKSSEKNLYNHPLLGEVVLVRSWRARRLSLTVRPSGEVRLSYPGFVSKTKALEFLDSRVEWVEQSRERFAERGAVRVEYSAEEIEQMRHEAKEWLPGRVAFWAEKFGFRYGRVTIRASRSKWGSCSGENNISLSLFLMTLPPHLRDYVIIHELCHTVHHNHSKSFHSLVDQCLAGEEKNLRSELRRFSI
ncbi:MAG: DUF45 domain-containing protein [Alistipes sp.]|nr:DUF45 domain-containing protein [Alistipes sp.]